jgi:hypothetical protein
MEQQNEETSCCGSSGGCGCAKEINAENLQFGPGCAGKVFVKGNLEMTQSAALMVQTENNVEVAYGGAGAIIAGKDAVVSYGGAETIIVGGNLEANYSGALLNITGGNVQATNSFFGIVISDKLQLGEGSQVLLNTQQAIAFGAAVGAVFALVRWLLKR